MWQIKNLPRQTSLVSAIQKTNQDQSITNTSLSNNDPIEKLMKSLLRYQPVSQLILIKNMKNPQIRKFKQSVYFGQLSIQNKREGMGVMLYTNGRIFEGYWINNYKQGKGYQKFANNSVYKGNYVKGKPDGCGKYQWQNGQLYQGQWSNGLKNGSGIWRGAKGDSYIGQWRQGKAQGYGVHTWVNGDRYEGQFQNCLKHGEGVQTFANGDVYKGNYIEGKPEGYGEYFWAGGSFFKGQFKKGLRNGQGLWKKGSGKSDKYEGQWKDDKKQGYGVFTWADGGQYRGHYLNDLRQGSGQMIYADGQQYCGLWTNDRPVQVEQPEDHIQMFIASTRAFLVQNQISDRSRIQQIYPEQPFLDTQGPGFIKSSSKTFRPQRSMLKQNTKIQLREFRPKAESVCSKKNYAGMQKKMSTGTMGYHRQMTRQDSQAMSSSFYLYKKGSDTSRRQVKTSGGSRNKRPQAQQQLKYYAKSRFASYSQLH